MPKPQYNEIDKECPLCGSIIWGKGQRVLLEGIKMTVCHNCAQDGIRIQKPHKITPSKKIYAQDKTSSTIRQKSKDIIVDDLEIIPDYAIKIRNTRNSLRLNQDQFAQKLNEKPSLIRRIESGKVEPTIKLAKKIEDVYKIKILKKIDEIESNIQDSKYMKKSDGTSLGDIAFIKKKK
ncbi:MAG: multiprotein bridging factor aMBF1 [Candidatus Hodarchaeota archaeon]